MTGVEEAREDVVVHALLAGMRAAGVRCALVERPDRLPSISRTFPDVTTDALYQVVSPNGAVAWWSVDVMLIPRSRRALNIAESFGVPMETFAEANGVEIRVEGETRPIELSDPVEVRDAMVASEVAAFADRVRAGVRGSRRGSVESAGLSATWWPAVVGAAFMAVFYPGPSASLMDQLVDTMAKPLQKKATKQSAAARTAGCRSAVVLDQHGYVGIEAGMHSMATHPHTFATAVEQSLEGVCSNLDAVLWIDNEDALHLATGTFPGVA